MKLNNITILITAAGTQVMPSLAACIKNNKERNIRIIGADMCNDCTLSQIVDKSYVVPGVFEKNYTDSILKICKEEKVDIFFPFMDEEIPIIYDSIEEFKRIGTIVSVPSKEIIEKTKNKMALYEFLKSIGVYVPEYYIVNNLEEYDKALNKLGYPEKAVCVKKIDGSGSRGVRILDASVDLYDLFLNEKPNTMFTNNSLFRPILETRKAMDTLMVMEYLPGEEVSIDLLATNGKVKYMVGRKSSNVLASIPQETTLYKNAAAFEMCKKIIGELKFDGNADLDFRFDVNGNLVLMELNPRFAATLGIIAVGGINLPYLRIKELLGEELPEIDENYDVIMKRKYMELYTNSRGDILKM